jgi:Family of unknown function (DUF6065)
MGADDIVITCDRPYQAVSNFTRGVVTFDVAYLFRTPPGYHLLVTGPTNILSVKKDVIVNDRLAQHLSGKMRYLSTTR